MKRILIRLTFSVFVLSTVLAPSISSASATLPTENTTVPSNEIVSSALKEFHSLSRKERKARIKEARLAYKTMSKEGVDAAQAEPSTNTVLLVILAILLPPLAVYLHQGAINTKFWISLVLTLLFWIPGVIYALLVVLGAA
jgi:uncharacterized membrane protein YqaE (UPF0057 family)